MTQAIKNQFIELATRFANHGQKHDFNTGFTILPFEGKNMEVRVYFSDYTKKVWAVYFSMHGDHTKTIEVADFAKKMSFGYLTTLKEMSFMILESTQEIEQLELKEVDLKNEFIKSKINELESNIQELQNQLKS